MNYAVYNHLPESYTASNRNYFERYCNQPPRRYEPYPLPHVNGQNYTQPNIGYFSEKQMTPTDCGLWVNNSALSPHDNGFHGYFEITTPFSNMQQVPNSLSPFSCQQAWSMPTNNAQECASFTASSSLANPSLDRRPVADKSAVSEEEKKSSTLWRMLSEVDSMEELAVTISGTRPLTELRAEDILEFEKSDNADVSMPTDQLIIKFSKENASSFRL